MVVSIQQIVYCFNRGKFQSHLDLLWKTKSTLLSNSQLRNFRNLQRHYKQKVFIMTSSTVEEYSKKADTMVG